MIRKVPILASGLLLGLSACVGSSTPPSAVPSAPATAAASASASSGPSAQASTGPTPLPVADDPTPIEAGTYLMRRYNWAVVDYSVMIPEGWAIQYGHSFGKNPDSPAEFGFYAVTVDEIFSNPCVVPSPAQPVGPGVDALVTALLEQPGPGFSDPVETTLGNHPAIRMDLVVPTSWTACPSLDEGIGLRVWLSERAGKNFLTTLDGTSRVYVLDFPAGRQVFLVSWRDPTTDAELAELQRVLDSIRFPAEPTESPMGSPTQAACVNDVPSGSGEWMGRIRPDAPSMRVLCAQHSWLDPRDASISGVDIVGVRVSPLGQAHYRMTLAGKPPARRTLERAGLNVAYGFVVDTTYDGIPDFIVGIEDRVGGSFRVWVTNLSRNETDEQLGAPYGWPVEFRHPDEQGVEDPDPAGMTFTFLPGTAPFPPRAGFRYYMWASATRGEEVVAWDYAPDDGWFTIPDASR